MNHWALSRRVKLSPVISYCVCRLIGRRCGSDPTCQHHVPEADHPSVWTRDGKAVIFVSQSYQICDTARLGEFCKLRNLACHISTRPAWHNPGNVLFVEIYMPERRRS